LQNHNFFYPWPLFVFWFNNDKTETVVATWLVNRKSRRRSSVSGEGLNNSMELEPSWEPNISSASQNNPCILRSPKVHYNVNNSSSLIPILSQMNTLSNKAQWWFILHFNFIFSERVTSLRITIYSIWNSKFFMASKLSGRLMLSNACLKSTYQDFNFYIRFVNVLYSLTQWEYAVCGRSSFTKATLLFSNKLFGVNLYIFV
jgi:hypothetical protein